MSILAAPDHIRPYCIKSRLTAPFDKENYDNGSFYSFVYQISCDCGCKELSVFKNEWPYVTAKCCTCGKELVIYDLEGYPAASSGGSEYKAELVQIYEKCELVAEFEYDDEYFYTDVRFDKNDITGFNLWAYLNDEYTLIVDDETA
ncbi:MAG: hypothetical protein IJ446_07315 [Oscillospiraceae bacterium]|nr:hypothetical protein [Oscillospiraceae bacterium]